MKKIILMLCICLTGLICMACDTLQGEPAKEPGTEQGQEQGDNDETIVPLPTNAEGQLSGVIFSGSFIVKKDEASYGHMDFLKNEKSGFFKKEGEDKVIPFIYEYESQKATFLFKDKSSLTGSLTQLDKDTYIITGEDGTYELSRIIE